MRIAFIVECFPRISETFILDQMTGFVDLGHEVRLFSLGKPDAAVPYHRDLEKYQLLNQTEYLDYTPGPVRGRMRRMLYFARHFPAALAHWARRSHTNAGSGLPFRCLFGKHIQKVFPLLAHQVDLVYCHFGTTAREFSFLRDHLKTPFVVAFWGYDVDLLPNEKPGVFDEVFSKFDLFCTPSHYLAGRLIRLGCPQERLMIQRIGLPTAPLSRLPLTRGTRPLKLLSVGRLVEAKGYAVAIEAVSKLRGDVEYCIIGDGSKRVKLTKLITELGVEQRVRLLGYMKREDVFQMMAESDIYICPSLRESFGVANLEASFFQLPVVASSIGGIPEVVQDGVTGLLVPPADVGALVNALDYLINHPESRQRMGEAGRRFVEAHFDHPSLMRQLEQQFQQLIARQQRA
jgi:colanic acid/amylovoran biosynthesis glycosyltransferase